MTETRTYEGTVYTTIQDRMGSTSEVPGFVSHMADWLGVAESDMSAEMAAACWIEACCEADQYCQSDFADYESALAPFSVALPSSVQSFVLMWACNWYVKRLPGASAGAIGSVSVSWSETQLATDKGRMLYPYRESPGL